MKTTTLLTAAALFLTLIAAKAQNVPSPDGKFAIDPANMSLVDNTGQTILVLTKNTTGASRTEITWSPDSHKLVVIENFPHGSGVFAARFVDGVWQKTLQSDDDQAAVTKQIPGQVVAENRSLGPWISADALQINGDLTISNGQHISYSYVLAFTDDVPHLDQGGYLEGLIKGRNYRLL